MKKTNTCPTFHDFISTDFIYNKDKYLRNECKSCGFINTEPIDGLTLDIYDSGHYQVKGFKIIPFLINLPDYLYIIFILKERGLNKNSSLLDFGCGKGFFLFTLKKLNYNNLYGLETSKSRANFSKKLTNLVISEEYYSSGRIMDKQFSIITLIHVLEHIPQPFLFLDNIINDALENSGFIFIEVPNINSISFLLAKNSWAHFTPHFHTNHFSVTSFIKYCKNRNLRHSFVGSFSFYNSAMGMTSAILSFFGYSGSIFEDLKKKKLLIIFSFILLLPISIILELLISFISKRGSVIKFIIYK